MEWNRWKLLRLAPLMGVALAAFPIHRLLAKPDVSGSIADWHAQDRSAWRSEGGELIGGIPPGDKGSEWLVRDTAYEDFMLRLRFQCVDGQAGVLLRGIKGDQGTAGIYVSLTGADAGSAYLLTLDKDGKEVGRKPLGVPHNQDDDLPVRFPLQAGGWNEVELDVRGDSLVESFNGYRVKTMELGDKASAPKPHYGLVALGLSGNSGAQLRVKDVAIDDHTERGALPAEITASPFHERKLTDLFYGEGIAAGDLNHDGYKDVVSGPFYYLGPDFKVAREIYTSATYNPNSPPYTDSFLTYLYDFNGDGWLDLLKINFDGAYVYINPRGEKRHWDVYQVVNQVGSETTQFTDVDGDGKPELAMSQGEGASYQISYAKPDWSNPLKPWVLHPVSERGNWGGHAMGVADINGDGRMDILQASGWWEQPPAGNTGLWKFHRAPFGGGAWAEQIGTWTGGSDMYAYDVNGDGLPDVITSLASHGWGLAWFEQKRDARGEISWKRHIIMGNPSEPNRDQWEETDKSVAFSELHAVALADINGDGLKDIITGKRWWSHGDNFSGPDAQAPPVLYWFQLVRKPGGEVSWVPHLINNNSGVGTQILATDLNGDGKIDILTAARKGTFVFLNSAR